MNDRDIRALLIGGPMYEPLYQRISEFERASGYRVEIVGRLPHPELNNELALRLAVRDHGLDLVSTHTKYAPSQAAGLRPLEDLLPADALEDLVPRARELAMLGGRLLQMPRLLDVGLLYYRRACFEDAGAREAFARAYHRELVVPENWNDLIDVATFLSGREEFPRHGFLFPGRESGLFGLFFQMLVSAGGELFGPDLRPMFASPAGEWAADRLAELHLRRRVTPRELPNWHYDEVSAAFRRGEAAMVFDWPGSDYLYREERHCADAARVELATIPGGFSGRRAAYGGCHSFAVPLHAPNPQGAAALLSFLTSPEAREGEAALGAYPVSARALASVGVAVKNDPRTAHRFALLTDLMKNAVIIPPRFAGYPRCEEILWRALQGIMLGQETPRDGLARAAREVEIAALGQEAS